MEGVAAYDLERIMQYLSSVDRDLEVIRNNWEAKKNSLEAFSYYVRVEGLRNSLFNLYWWEYS